MWALLLPTGQGFSCAGGRQSPGWNSLWALWDRPLCTWQVPGAVTFSCSLSGGRFSWAAPCWGLGGCPWGEGTALFYRAHYKCSMALLLVWALYWMSRVWYYSWTAGNAQKSHFVVCMAWVGRGFCEGSRLDGKSGLLNCSFLAIRGITDKSTEAANQLTNCH